MTTLDVPFVRSPNENYIGQHRGWDFFVAETPGETSRFHHFIGIAIPPVDGLPYTTEANGTQPDPSKGVPPRTVQVIGMSKAEAIYKAVDASIELQHHREESPLGTDGSDA